MPDATSHTDGVYSSSQLADGYMYNLEEKILANVKFPSKFQ